VTGALAPFSYLVLLYLHPDNLWPSHWQHCQENIIKQFPSKKLSLLLMIQMQNPQTLQLF